MLKRFFSIIGKATKEKTEFYASRNVKVAQSNWRQTTTGLTISSVGIGTYMGVPDDATDVLVATAVYDSVCSGGLNHIDTAINYRYQKAERAISKGLNKLMAEGFARDELFLASKIGYIPEDADNGIPGKSVIAALIKNGLISDQDVVGGVHCMHPEFLSDQLSRSLKNLGVDTIDLMYLHNTAEAQLPLVGEKLYWERLGKAFEYLESARAQGKIQNYGMASWICFRSPITEPELHVSLEKAVKLAEEVGGKDHGMKFIQLPINIMMPESFIHTWQEYKGENQILLNVAKELDINVIASSPLLQGKIIDLRLSKTMIGIDLQACKHLQLIRSIPSSSIKSVLVGMKNPRSVAQNLQLFYVDTLTAEDFWLVLKPEGKEKVPVAIDLW